MPTKIITNPKNDAHIMAIVTKNGQTIGKDVVDFDEDSNEMRSDERENKIKKWLKKSKYVVPWTNEYII